jgi:prevent-host-death family protein
MATTRMDAAPSSAARGSFADMVNRAAYGKERVVVTRRGKALAAIVPIEDVLTLEAMEDEADARLIAKRYAAWERGGRKSVPLHAVMKKSRALAKAGK